MPQKEYCYDFVTAVACVNILTGHDGGLLYDARAKVFLI